MRYLRLMGAAVLAALALGAMVAATASAEDGLFLKSGTKNGFSISGGKGTLTTLTNFFSITCTGASGSGSVSGNDTETFKGTVDFTGCNGKSLGDGTGVILFKFKGLLCTYTEGGVLKVGAFIESEEGIHIDELPLGLLVLFLAGSSQIAEVTPTKSAATKFTMTFAASGNGDQKVPSCLDLGVTLTPEIKANENENTSTHGAINTALTITAEESTTVDG